MDNCHYDVTEASSKTFNTNATIVACRNERVNEDEDPQDEGGDGGLTITVMRMRNPKSEGGDGGLPITLMRMRTSRMREVTEAYLQL